MPPVAPLPLWPIYGLEFDPALHLDRVLSVFGCSTTCPFFSSAQDRAYASTVFSNARDLRTGLQCPPGFPDVRPIYARMDHWLYREHDHPVDSDLVYQYPRFHTFPFLFSWPICVAGLVERNGFVDDEVWDVSCIHVADIHLRWSEIVRGVHDATYSPSRYPQDAYPFSRSYFRTICSLFNPLPRAPHASPSDLRLRHSATGLPVARGSYRLLTLLTVDFDISHPPEDPLEPEWYLLRVPTTMFVRQLELHSGHWWPDLDAVVRHLRLVAVGMWLDEQRDRHAHTSTELRHAVLDAPLVLSDWEHDTDDKAWGWWMTGF
ncbi:hypothetical protein V8D89_006330 [Ganoderma adspersum]